MHWSHALLKTMRVHAQVYEIFWSGEMFLPVEGEAGCMFLEGKMVYCKMTLNIALVLVDLMQCLLRHCTYWHMSLNFLTLKNFYFKKYTC